MMQMCLYGNLQDKPAGCPQEWCWLWPDEGKGCPQLIIGTIQSTYLHIALALVLDRSLDTLAERMYLEARRYCR